MAQLCSQCGKRPALSISKGTHANRGHKSRKNHDLCRQCWKAMWDRNVRMMVNAAINSGGPRNA